MGGCPRRSAIQLRDLTFARIILLIFPSAQRPSARLVEFFICRRNGDRVRVFSRRGHDWTVRVPRIAKALAALPVKSLTLDGEGVVCREDGAGRRSRRQSGKAAIASDRETNFGRSTESFAHMALIRSAGSYR